MAGCTVRALCREIEGAIGTQHKQTGKTKVMRITLVLPHGGGGAHCQRQLRLKTFVCTVVLFKNLSCHVVDVFG